jgi:hypothetical protein
LLLLLLLLLQLLLLLPLLPPLLQQKQLMLPRQAPTPERMADATTPKAAAPLGPRSPEYVLQQLYVVVPRRGGGVQQRVAAVENLHHRAQHAALLIQHLLPAPACNPFLHVRLRLHGHSPGDARA